MLPNAAKGTIQKFLTFQFMLAFDNIGIKQNEKETISKMVAARGENRSTTKEMPQVAIKNRAFLSILRALISFFNSLISAFRKSISFEFIFASRRKRLKSKQYLITNSVRQQKLLMTHALVSADSHRS